MMTRNILSLAGAGLMLATSFAAYATTPAKATTSSSQSCKGLKAKALKDCMAQQKHAVTKPATQPK